MAHYMSNRDLRRQRRETQKEVEERNRNEQLERELMDKELELIRKQREQLRQDRQRERLTEVDAVDRDIEYVETDRRSGRYTEMSNLDGSYINESLRGEFDETVLSFADETGFDEDHISRNSTHIREDINIQDTSDKDMRRESPNLSVETERLNNLLWELNGQDQEQTFSKLIGQNTPDYQIYMYRETPTRDMRTKPTYVRDKSQDNTLKGIQSQDTGVSAGSYRTPTAKGLRDVEFQRNKDTKDGNKSLDWTKNYKAEEKLEERRTLRDQKSIKEEIKRREREMILLKEEESLQEMKAREREMLLPKGEESLREMKAMERLKQKEYELDKHRHEQEEYERRMSLKYKEQEYEFLMERKRLREEVEGFKRQLYEENERKEMELRQRQEAIEEVTRKDIEMKVRKEIEESIRKEMELRKLHDEDEKQRQREESERLKRIEKAEQRRRIEREEKGKIVKLKREKQKDEEIKLIEKIEHLKNLERDIDLKEEDKPSETEMSEDEEDKIMQERLEKLKREMEGLQDRIQKKSNKNDNKQKKTTESKTTSDKSFGKPELPQFDGTQFEYWKLEVTSLMESCLYQDYILAQAVRNSIISNARKVLQTLRPLATTTEILKKMEDIYGNIRSGDSIIHEFYSARQNDTEACSEWGVRIETLFNQAVERGEIEESRKDKKLKERFWRGLLSEKIKIATRSTYESSSSFDILRKKARIEELEIQSETLPSANTMKDSDMKRDTHAIPEEVKTCQPIHRTEETSLKMDELLKKMMELEKEIRDIKRNQSDYSENRRGIGGYGGYRPRPYGGPYRRRQYGDVRNDESSKKSEEKKKDTAPKDQTQDKSVNKDNLN